MYSSILAHALGLWMTLKYRQPVTCENVLQTTQILNLYSIRNSIFSGTEQFFSGTQAFASPPDMASSGVWENIILCKTPTFDGCTWNGFHI